MMKDHSLASRTALGIVVSALAASTSLAQLTPDRTYFGVGRPVPMKVAVPSGKTGAATIQIFAPGTDAPAAKADATPGAVDLATLFPKMWTDTPAKLMYAQLVVGDEKVGAPVVLQPLTAPAMARSGGQGVQWMPNPDTKTSGLRAYVEQRIVMNTTLGEITFALRPDHAPNTSWNFMDLVKGGFYTDIIFHRIMGPQNGRGGFMAQVGDPTGTGSGGPGYNIDLENSKLPHDFGVLSMARTADPNTNGSQVFVCFSREGTSFLDGNYCAFAQAVSGADVIKKLEAVEVKSPAGGGEPSQPINPPRIISAKLVDAPPFGTGLKPVSTGANSAAPKPDGR